MGLELYKFPSTPHLVVVPGCDVRGDKVLTPAERDALLQHHVVVEEKVDGANLGVSFDVSGSVRMQNRGGYLIGPHVGQWKKVDSWLSSHIDVMFEVLSDQYIVFGEWCYAEHSIHYTRLPDWFLVFDVFDKIERQFVSVQRRNAMVELMGLATVPYLGSGVYSLADIRTFLTTSRLADTPAEGVCIRADEGEWLTSRAKLVRPTFIQQVDEHWSRRTIRPNRLYHR